MELGDIEFDAAWGDGTAYAYSHKRIRFGVLKGSGTPVAVKQVSSLRAAREKTSQFAAERLAHEARMLELAGAHPHIVTHHGLSHEDDCISLITEAYGKGSLESAIAQDEGLRFQGTEAKTAVLLQIAQGLRHLHGRGICHRDIKPSNVLLRDAANGQLSAALADFDRAACVDLSRAGAVPGHLLEPDPVGSRFFMAPELLRRKLRERDDGVAARSPMSFFAVDVYAFAMLAYCLLEAKQPFSQDVSRRRGIADALSRQTDEAVMAEICDVGLRPQWGETVDTDLRDLMSRCWADDPGARPGFADICDAMMPKSARRAVRDAPQITLCSATSKGRRKTQEDAVFQWQISPHAAVLAVFDGHNGHAVADFGAECLEREFMTGRLQQALLDVRGANPARHLLDELSRRIGRAPPALAEGTGAAATIIVVSPTHIHCAHLGDCDAVLYRKPHEGGEGGSLVARQLTEPHRPGTARERARLEAMPDHAVIDRETRMQDDGIAYPFGPFRVYRVTEDGAKRGGLAVSRALGNLGLRPAVSSEPEAISVARTSQNDVCVVLGSDGLWDVAGVDEIAMWLTESPGDGRSHALTAAAGLLDMALQKGSQDNVSAGVIWL